jgi:hypothetical protein
MIDAFAGAVAGNLVVFPQDGRQLQLLEVMCGSAPSIDPFRLPVETPSFSLEVLVLEKETRRAPGPRLDAYPGSIAVPIHAQPPNGHSVPGNWALPQIRK